MKTIQQMVGSVRARVRGIVEGISLSSHRQIAREKAWQTSSDYDSYLDTQLKRTFSKRQTDLPRRTVTLIDKISSCVDLSSRDVLCVGVRNTNEIKYFQQKKARSVIGIDLFSEDDLVLVMDMHQMEFPDNAFDLVYSCHSLEHAYDAGQVAQELLRVCRPGGVIVIEVPVNFTVQGADLIDFSGYEKILALFQPRVDTVLLAENDPQTPGAELSASRVIFKIKD